MGKLKLSMSAFAIFALQTAVIINIAWGLFLISLFSFSMAQAQNKKTHYVVFEHLLIAAFVIILAHYLGKIVAVAFG